MPELPIEKTFYVSLPIPNLRLFMLAMEKELITEALGITENNRSRTAQLLGLNRTTLIEKMRKHGWDIKRA